MKKAMAILMAASLMLSAVSALADGIYTGGDMTEVTYIEKLGGVYKDEDGNKVDPFEFMRSKGVNMARIRLSNKPGKGRGDGTYYMPEGYQDIQDCLALCKRAKDAGMAIEFTFNYSDYWSNGERQIVPADWVEEMEMYTGFDISDPDFLKSMTAEQKKTIQEWLIKMIDGYTAYVMGLLKEQDTLPEYVSLGNEINGGMLFPFGNAYKANMNKDRFELVFDDKIDNANDIICPDETAYLLKFLKAGYDAVKSVSPDTKVIVHLATAGNNAGNDINDGRFTWLMDKIVNAGCVDVLGASYYPAWSGATADKAAAFCERMYAKYNKPVMIMETGFNWNPTRKDGYAGQLVDVDGYKDTCPPSKEGQKRFLEELFGYLQDTNGACIGVLYWDPCMIHVEDPNKENASLSGWAYRESDDGVEPNVVENTTLFDFDGKALPAFDAFSINAPAPARLTGSVSVEGDWIKATVTNGLNEKKKACLIVATYTDGVLDSVKIADAEVDALSSASLELQKPETEFKKFLWNGENFSPIDE